MNSRQLFDTTNWTHTRENSENIPIKKIFPKKERLKNSLLSSRVTDRWCPLFMFFQLLSVGVSFFMTHIVYRTRVHYPENFTVESGILVISNHQSMYDPFLVSYHLSRRLHLPTIFSTFPMRYPVINRFMEKPLVGFLIFLFGGYNIGKNTLDRMKGLLYTMNLLDKGTTVLLFPEGKIVKSDKVGYFNGGLDIVLRQNIPIRLVRLKGMHRWSWFNFSDRHQIDIYFSNIIKDMSYEEKRCIVDNFYERNN